MLNTGLKRCAGRICFGSDPFSRSQRAVGGISCIRPQAPALDTAKGSKCDSTWITAATNAGSRPLRRASRTMAAITRRRSSPQSAVPNFMNRDTPMRSASRRSASSCSALVAESAWTRAVARKRSASARRARASARRAVSTASAAVNVRFARRSSGSGRLTSPSTAPDALAPQAKASTIASERRRLAAARRRPAGPLPRIAGAETLASHAAVPVIPSPRRNPGFPSSRGGLEQPACQ